VPTLARATTPANVYHFAGANTSLYLWYFVGVRLVVLGGTKFVGRALVEAALERGHQVTLFNRGLTNPELFAGQVERIQGDRTQDLSALAGRRWDAAVDVATYVPEDVARALEALASSTRRYLYVSTVSVYADQSVPAVEGAPVLELEDSDDRTIGSYGALKAVCEKLVIGPLGERATVVRPGLIVGPFDPTDRFSYWPRRIARGGHVLAPGGPNDPLQFIDVRDLADFMLKLLEDNRPGIFNATGRTMSFASLLAVCQEVTGNNPQLTWVPSKQLVDAGLDPWMGIPLWIGEPGWEAANQVDITRALGAGLVFRPLEVTVEAAMHSPPPARPSEFTFEREQDLLAQL